MTIQDYEKYIPTIKAVIHSYGATHPSLFTVMPFEDCVQEMYFVYAECINKYDSSKAKFETYLSRQVEYKLKQIFRKQFRNMNTDCIDDYTYCLEVPGHDTKTINDIDNKEKVAVIKDLIEENKNKDLLTDYFLNRFKMKQLRQKYNQYSRDKIIKILYRFKNKVKEILN